MRLPAHAAANATDEDVRSWGTFLLFETSLSLKDWHKSEAMSDQAAASGQALRTGVCKAATTEAGMSRFQFHAAGAGDEEHSGQIASDRFHAIKKCGFLAFYRDFNSQNDDCRARR